MNKTSERKVWSLDFSYKCLSDKYSIVIVGTILRLCNCAGDFFFNFAARIVWYPESNYLAIQSTSKKAIICTSLWCTANFCVPIHFVSLFLTST